LTLIADIRAREILDSRGSPTIEAEARLTDGAVGIAAVPSGASVGAHEALELRDHDSLRFGGRGVLKAVDNVHQRIAPALRGRSPFNQYNVDGLLLELDGTPNKANLGANALLAASLAVAHAAASSKGVPLYRYLALSERVTLPVPMFNILNGGAHASDSIDLQEIMVVPAGAPSFREAVRVGAEIYQALKDVISGRGLSTDVGDEGGFAPRLQSNRSALELVALAVERAGYVLGEDCYLALDAAATEFMEDGRYHLHLDGISLNAEALTDFYRGWSREFHIISIEDGLAEDDWTGWQGHCNVLGNSVQLVGDDLYTTNRERIRRGILMKTSNAVLLKLNQAGTVTETI
jgi:enolase